MRVFLENSTRLQLCDPTELARVEPGQWAQTSVAKLLTQLIEAMPQLNDALTAGYFAHSVIHQQQRSRACRTPLRVMNYRITHRTTYAYSAQVAVSHHAARLRPRDTDTQRCLEFGLSFDPEPDLLTEHTDSFGNRVSCFSMQKLHTHFEVVSRSHVSLTPVLQPDPAQTPPGRTWPRCFVIRCQSICWIPASSSSAARCWCMRCRCGFCAAQFHQGPPGARGAADLCRRIHREFVFDPKATTISTPLAEVLENKRGVCQDFAHLAIASLRAMGLPARYISGYLRTRPPAGKPRLVRASMPRMHGLPVLCPALAGWISIPPTTASPRWTTSPSPSAVISPMSVPCAASSPAVEAHSVGVGVDVEPVEA
jgi:transglutaminase-like putative cysteine protease